MSQGGFGYLRRSVGTGQSRSEVLDGVQVGYHMPTNSSWALQEELRQPGFNSVLWYSLSQSESILIWPDASAYYHQSFEVLFEWIFLTPRIFYTILPYWIGFTMLFCVAFFCSQFGLSVVPLERHKSSSKWAHQAYNKAQCFFLFLCRGINPSLSFLSDQYCVISEYRWWRTKQINA